MAFDEFLGDLIADVLIPAVLKLIRFPGALLSWAIWRRRTWSQIWNEGSWFGQGVAGLAVHLTWILAVLR